jgi:broad specificity phosphatase PhoE
MPAVPPADPTVVLVRHGETEWSRAERHTGRTDIVLTGSGLAAASALRARLAPLSIGPVWVSPARRAQATAASAGLARCTAEPDLWEWDYGAYEGLTTAQIRAARPHWGLWDDGCPGGETIEQVAARADRVIEKVRAQAAEQVDGGAACLVAHGHLLRILAARWLGVTPEAGRFLALSPASISVLGWERETPVIQRWNET